MRAIRRLMPRPGMARHPRTRMNPVIVFGLAFVLMEVISGAALYTNFVKTRQRYCSKELEQLQVAYQAILNTYEQTAHLLFSEMTAAPVFLDTLHAARNADAVTQNRLRDGLLTTLQPRYRQLWEQHVDALEVHFPDGVNFMRIQEPTRYGDALADLRSSIRLVNTQRLTVKGFERSASFAGDFGFRYLFPVYAGDEYRGIVEIGITIDGVRAELEELFMREFLFLFPKASFDARSPSGASTPNRLNDRYVRDDTNVFIHEGETTLTAIDAALGATITKQLEQASAFVATARVQRRDFLVTFLPVFDIERRHAAFLVSYKEDSTIREYLLERLWMMSGASVGSVILCVTVYLLRRSRIRIAQDERRFKLITESMHEGVCVLDQENLVTFVNPTGMQMLQYDWDEVYQVQLSDLTRYQIAAGPVWQGVECPVYQAIAKGQRYASDQYVLLTKAGQTVPVELTSAPILQGRTWVGSVVVFRDITARKQTEAQLQQMNRQLQEASRHKSEFLSRMSHELRTPLNAIIGYTTLTIDLLKDHENPKLAQNLRKAERSSRKLLELINDVLDFSKIEAGHMETFIEDVELIDVLDEALFTAEGLLFDKAVQLKTELAPAFPVLRTDYTKLTQILNNLLGNAVKFTEHGSVTVRAFLRQEEQSIRIEVEDTGCGIPEEKLDTIFESFKQGDNSTTRKFGGTGLGLAITKKFCDMLGIELGVQSVIGRGSLFWLHVPMSHVSPVNSAHQARVNVQGAVQSAQAAGESIDAAGDRPEADSGFPDEDAPYERVYPDCATLVQQRHCLSIA